MFDRVTCITLETRPDRWDRFISDLPNDWPFERPERVLAIDGKKCPAPPWWRQGNPAWGCYRSHLRILEECLNEGVDSILFLEDDAICADNFGQQWQDFYEALPDDWQMLYLGGQHLDQDKSPPEKVNDFVYRPMNVNRTHAFALRGRDTLRAVYRHLNATRNWKERHHIDHHLGRIHQEYKTYCPARWLVGQNDTQSTISGLEPAIRFWMSAADVQTICTPFVAVVGLHRSGSSCLAGCLHEMGVHMGNKFVGYEANGGYEAQDLARLCEDAMPFPSIRKVMEREDFYRRLRLWICARSYEAREKQTMCGGKYPHLCTFLPIVKDVCGDALRVVHIDRPYHQSVESLHKRTGRDKQVIKQVQRFLWDEKRKHLSVTEHITVEFDDLLTNPTKELTRIAEYLELEEPNIDDAANMVDTDKVKFGS
jgi:GR25 family glycosyltransferase involved in LPS biosynthesis